MSDLSTRLEGMSRRERATLLEFLRKKKGEAAAAAEASSVAPPRAPAGDLPLSFPQQRLWVIDRLSPGSPLYNVPGSLRCRGGLDLAVLAACLSEVVRRHATLRTRFEIRGDGPVQIVEPAGPLPLPLIDLSALPEDVRLPEAERIVRAEHLRPFDLARPPLLRARLLRLAAEEHLFSYVFHHIASDGWSLDIMVREVAALYAAFHAGRPSPLPELPLQYADFAWEQVQALSGETLEREIAWWRPRLAGAPALELPTDRPRPAVPSFRGRAWLAPVAPAVEAGLRELAHQERVTLFMATTALVSALLARLAGASDVVRGTVVLGRDRWYLQDLIGFFVNSLVLRLDHSGDPGREALLAQTRDVVLGAFTHQKLPFEKLVDELGLPRDPHRPPLLRVLVQLALFPSTVSFPGLALEPFRLSSETSKFDLGINAVEVNGRLWIEWRHDLDLFDAETVDRWAASFDTLLGAWLENPALRTSELPLLAPAERRQLLTAWNPVPLTGDRGRRSLPALFEAQVDRTPDAVAVSVDGFALTYRELDARAGRLARWLQRAGVVPGDRVALRLERAPELVVALLAVLKAGAAYVPLDPAVPEERLAFALEDSGASLVLDAALVERELHRTDRTVPSNLVDPELTAYVIYTSGSTGRPKGVVVPHGAVTRLLSATEAWFGFGPGDVWTLFHSYAFDFSVWEIWGALLYGGRLVVVPWSVSRDPEAFLDLLAREGVTVLNQTPSAFRLLTGSTATSLRFVIFGGEALDPSMLAPWFDRHGDERPRLVNMYGITETTVHVTYRPLSREDAARPASLIGRPIPDLSVHVLNPRLELQPLGIPGELCVGGEGLAQGYLDRPDLTAARFVPDPHGEPGARLYRSGDLARRRPDGDLEFLGRIDHQVKIRGFRIELGEIEAALAALPGVREAVVLAREDGAAGERRLVAYLTAERDDLTLAEMREALSRRLPDYMIPSALVLLDRLPLTANGKVDRRALPDPDSAPVAASGHFHVPPRDALEEHLAGLFRQILNVPAAR
jgi:amino acid adenylation domain-containing protein